MAEAARITKGWIGLNATDEEVKALVAWWKDLTDNVDAHDLDNEYRQEYLRAQRIIHALERAT